MSRALARLFGLTALWAAVELLERVAYRAGLDDAAADLPVQTPAGGGLGDAWTEDLPAFDASDVIALHLGLDPLDCVCCRSGAATPPGSL